MQVEEAEGMRPQDRLRRFLQAYGLDTSRLKEEDLNKYIKGKPLFLNLGGVIVRAPMLYDAVRAWRRHARCSCCCGHTAAHPAVVSACRHLCPCITGRAGR
jgi:hypothetical protein